LSPCHLAYRLIFLLVTYVVVFVFVLLFQGGSGDGFGSRYDTLALHYDATLLAGCYQLDATHTEELLEVGVVGKWKIP